MARTKKQEIAEKPVWLKYTADEVKAIILKLGNKEGMTAEKIGLELRDRYGIPKVKLFDLKIKKVLGDKYIDPNIANLRKKSEKLQVHNKSHKHDRKTERSMIITKAKLKKREDYEKIE